MPQFKENLKRIRIEKGYKTAKDFAAELDLPYTTYINWENKGREPDYSTLVKIAAALHVTTDDLLGYEVDKLENMYKLLKSLGFKITHENGGVSVYPDILKDRDGTVTFYISRYLSPEDLYNSVETAKKKFEQQTRSEFKSVLKEQFYDDLHNGKAFFKQGSLTGSKSTKERNADHE